jgi:hypothetical protein
MKMKKKTTMVLQKKKKKTKKKKTMMIYGVSHSYQSIAKDEKGSKGHIISTETMNECRPHQSAGYQSIAKDEKGSKGHIISTETMNECGPHQSAGVGAPWGAAAGSDAVRLHATASA